MTVASIIPDKSSLFLVADHSKFGRNAMVKFGNFREINTLITDRKPPKQRMEVILKYDVTLMID